MTEQKEMAYVPQQTAQTSKEKKRQRRTMSQLQVYRDVSFVGTIIKPGRLYLSNRTRARLTERCYGFRKVLGAEDVTLLDLGRIEQVLNSYLGFCRRRRTYRFRKRLINRLGERFWEYYYVRGHYDSIRLKKKYQLIL